MKRYLLIFLIFVCLFQPVYPNEISISFDKEIKKEELNLLIKKYILENPEIIIEAIEIYQKKQTSSLQKKDKELIKSLNNEIFYDKNSYYNGDKDSKIKLVEFIDYNCGYCKKNHEIIMKLLKSNKDLQYIIKELPILGQSSLLASKFAISIYLTDGPLIYEKFYNSLMNFSSKVNITILKKLAKKSGSTINDFDNNINQKEINAVIFNNLSLADKLSINGTPTFIIQDTIIRGFLSFDELQEIIDKYRKNQ